MTDSKLSAGHLFKFSQDSYFERTSRPIYAIIFLLPFIIFYELGTIFINTDILNQSQVRVVAFVWLQDFLSYLGLGERFTWAAPALVVVVILLALQLTSRKKWNFWTKDIVLMAGECVLLAIPLIVLTLFIGSSFRQIDNPADPCDLANGRLQLARYETPAANCSAILTTAHEQNISGSTKQRFLADIVTGIGAGIYEELIFRLILICLLLILFQDVLRFGKKTSIIISILISAVLFSAHHHIDFLNGHINQADPFDWAKFCFRTIAGVYFAILFAARGFGITAGTHAIYDIMAVFVNACFFEQQ